MSGATWTPFVEQCVDAGLQVDTNVAMAQRTTYGVGGSAAVVVVVHSESDALALSNAVAQCQVENIVVVGRGSNVLVSDEGFDGVVVMLGAVSPDSAVSVEGDVVQAGGSVLMPVLARRSVGAGRGGLEWCVGIPGTVGGAVRMNAGGHGAEMIDNLINARVVSLKSGKVCDVANADLGMHFRGSALSQHHVVLSARFQTSNIAPEEGTATINSVVAWRREHQPGGRNAGSVFVNPAQGEGSAGALIDAAALRGYSRGGASVSEKHANFIQASDNATAADVVAVMSDVQQKVFEVHGIMLRSEVVLVGFDERIADQFSDLRHSALEQNDARAHLSKLLGDGDE
ncbi:MAG: UDP-N-acetylenolpyruvoylglucosamine reductase [Actinomycetota bacterium]